MQDFWFRAEDKRYANYDPWAEFEQPSGSHLKIEMRKYLVERYTPKRVILEGHGFVCGLWIKQFASPTKALALAELVARKRAHVRGAEIRATQAREHLAEAIAMLEKEINSDSDLPQVFSSSLA